MAESSYSGTAVDCAYSVVVQTSGKENAGTTANVFVQVCLSSFHQITNIYIFKDSSFLNINFMFRAYAQSVRNKYYFCS